MGEREEEVIICERCAVVQIYALSFFLVMSGLGCDVLTLVTYDYMVASVLSDRAAVSPPD